MLKPHEKIRLIIHHHKWTQQQAADAFGVSQATIYRWKEGKAEPEGPHRDAINEAYDQTFGETVDDNRSLLLPVGIPVVGAIQAGNWLDTTLIDESYGEPKTLPVAADPRFPYAKQYALEVRGDSMNEEFAEGSYVICVDYAQSGLDMKENMIVHVEQWRHNLREITLKALMKEKETGRWRLEPRSTNPAHRPIEMNGIDRDGTEVRIRGVVIGDYRRRVF